MMYIYVYLTALFLLFRRLIHGLREDLGLHIETKAFYVNGRGVFGRLMSVLRMLVGPKYNGKYLDRLIKEKLGGTRLHETLTSVIIPTFDIRNLQPTIFSTYEVCSLLPFGSAFS